MAARLRTILQDSSAAAEDAARGAINVALAELQEAAEQVSLAVCLPRGYLRTYLECGLPATLPAPVRRRLASYLGLPEQSLR